LVQWKGRPAAKASWMKVAEFKELYPLIQLEDELLLQGGRDVMVGLTYQRKKKGQHGQGSVPN
jgi:hypothetical protein